ncbi:MAG: hypothetical protein H6656_16495 [Ardenticatenaceae bacterium]|nr:hypothetical protein [Ardenticatenaceae bacterium]
MNDTGCQWVNIGVESASQEVLDRMTKDQDAEQILWGIGNLVKAHRTSRPTVHHGMPEEQPHETKEPSTPSKSCRMSEKCAAPFAFTCRTPARRSGPRRWR